MQLFWGHTFTSFSFCSIAIVYPIGATCDNALMAQLPNSSFNASSVYPGAAYDIGLVRLFTPKIGSYYGALRTHQSNKYQFFQVSSLNSRKDIPVCLIYVLSY